MTEVDAAVTEAGRPAHIREPVRAADPSPLDSRIDFARFGWFGVLAVAVLAIAAVIRFVNLDAYALSPREGEWAYDAWALFTGKPLPAGQDLPVISPLFLILQSTTFFLFGVTDAIARSFPALVGVGLVALVFGFRPFLSRMSVFGMALLAAISPTLIFASRTIDPAILIAFLAVLALLALLRTGYARGIGVRYWAGVFGAAVAGMVAAGPEGITTIVALGIGLAVASVSDSRQGEDRHHGPVSAGVGALIGSTGALVAAIGAFVIVSLLAFSRLLSNAAALEGFLTTFSDWGRMMASQPSSTPTSFFFYAALLYEVLAVAFAIVAVTTRPAPGPGEAGSSSLQPTLFLTWFAAALVLQSLASGRQPDQTILVTLPLVLLGGIGLGRMLERIPWGTLVTTRNGVLPLAMFALFIGLAGVVTLIARSNDPQTAGTSPALGAIGVALIVVIPLGLVIFREATVSDIPRYAGWSALLVVALMLGFYTVRSATQLAWLRADNGTELVAQRIPTEGTRSFVDQTLRLSRDLSLTEVSAEDNTGSYGISIAIDPAIEWPFAWYFRDFPDMRVVSPAGWDNADMVIAPTSEGMEDAGYVVQSRNWLNRVPAVYEDLDLGTVLSSVFSPSKWYDGFRYLFYREMATPPVPEQMSVGYTFRLSNQMNPTSGPFDLTTGQSLGPGAALGQLDQPTGIAVSPDGETIYIVDSGNRRIQRFGRDGSFIGAWSAETEQRLGLGLFDQGQQGASDMVVGPDGLIYVADTWNHRVMVLDATGQLVRELGRPGEVTDTGDSPDPTVQPGLFYGPRGVAVANGEIYVTDTGNERVQVFAPDGTFLRAFGGYGREPGRLIEPVGIAIGPDGYVYVADTGNARISVFTPAGESVTQIPVPGWEGLVGQQTYLKFGANGVLYISSPGTGEILAWNGTGFATVAGGPAGGEITAPVGLALTPDGMMLVTEPSETRVNEIEIALPEGFAPNPGATPMATPQPTIPSTPDAVG